MAIEFECPKCAATVRVGAEAAGKIGRCPSCSSRVRIPQPPVPGATPPAGAMPTASTAPSVPPSESEIPTFSGSQSGSPVSTAVETAPPLLRTEEDTPVLYRERLRRRRKPSLWGTLAPPLFFGTILVAIAAAYWMWTRPAFNRPMTGRVVQSSQPITSSIDLRTLSGDQEAYRRLAALLAAEPADVRSNVLSVRCLGTDQGITMLLRPGPDVVAVEVPLTSSEPIAEAYHDLYERLDRLRRDELQQAIAAMATSVGDGDDASLDAVLLQYRDRLVSCGAVRGLGRICEAIVDRTRYPCVHEDVDGNLTFLVPVGTKQFIVRERDDVEGGPFLPSPLKVPVQVASTSSGAPVPTEPVEPANVEPIPYQVPEPEGDGASPSDGDEKPMMAPDAEGEAMTPPESESSSAIVE